VTDLLQKFCKLDVHRVVTLTSPDNSQKLPKHKKFRLKAKLQGRGLTSKGTGGSKTLHQQNTPVLNWRCGLMQVDLYNGHKTVVVVAVDVGLHHASSP